MNDVEDLQIKATLDHIKKYATTCPANLECVITELNSICNKFDPDIVEGRKEPLPLVSPKFAPKIDETYQRIRTIVGEDIKIPELRFQADDLSRMKKIPLPSSTRKHKEPLLQWFDVHWDVIEPFLYDWAERKKN